ncbi:hypothetical protein MHH62_16220 [Pseudomonas sp. FSL L8-0168]|uniref:hypothetical protein n=1 Tax=Pseudomonas sp. FSL L8-0168 TaxID=2921518 RepID=UPI0030DAFED1
MPIFYISPQIHQFLIVNGIWPSAQRRVIAIRMLACKTRSRHAVEYCLAHNADSGTVALNLDCFAGSFDIEAWMAKIDVHALLLFDVV